MRLLPLLTVQFAALVFLVFTGPVVTQNLFILSLEVFSVFIIVWTLWTIKFDRFSLFNQDGRKSRLVPKGPYMYVRHPIYTAIIILSVCWLVNSLTIPRGFAWIVFIITVYLTINHYEKVLSSRLSDYGLYKQRTYKVIPFIF